VALPAIPLTVHYGRREKSVIMLERIRIVIHVTMVGKAIFARFPRAIKPVVA